MEKVFAWTIIITGLVGGLVAPSMTRTRVKSRVAHVAGWILWFLFAFVASQFIVVFLTKSLGKDISARVDVTVAIQALTYFLTFAMMIWLPWLRFRHQQKSQPKKNKKKLTTNKADMRRFVLKLSGLDRRPTWNDVKQYAVHFPLYFVTNMIASLVLMLFVSADIMNKEQNVGFATTGQNPLSLTLIFFCLVILAPLFEEMLIRGALFSKIREKLKFWPAALLTASVFALIHGQFNVGVMTFVLALYAAYLREKTGAIWSGIMLHATQNFIAFCLLFLR